ncbi:MAG: N-acetylmuramoyl-L-alanine amidase [Prevotella sp.]|nr:N-acetylmuramoyl-L-alanine amidase [Prevotella sp.]
MRKKIVYILLALWCFAAPAGAADKRFTLVIDAGHGGGDAGAIGRISKEKNLTLKFALAFGRLVERNCPDVRVVYTRKSDVFVPLWERAEIANKHKADLFISIHINAIPGKRPVSGFQTYTLGRSRRNGNKNGVLENLEVAKRENAVIYQEKDYRQTYKGYDPNSTESNIMFEFVQDKNMENSVQLAKYMQKYVCQATGRQDMGAHQDNLAVLRLTSMPGCLIELGFISNRNEEQYMNTDNATNSYARGIYNAFVAYKKKFSKGITVPFLPEPAPIQDPEPVRKTAPENGKHEESGIPPIENQPKDEVAAQNTVPEKELKRDSSKETKKADDTEQGVRTAAAEKVDSAQLFPVTTENKRQGQQADEAPVFKVQLVASSRVLKSGSPQLKGLKEVDYYQEGGLYKYTVGASTDYRQIQQLRRSVLNKFPEAFIIAFKNGEKTDVRKAIETWRKKR